MASEEIEQLLSEIKNHIDRKEWSSAIVLIAKLAVYCNQMHRKTESETD